MRNFPPITTATGLLALGLVLCCAGCKRKPAPAARPAAAPPKATVLAETNSTAEQFVSVFEDLPPSRGRDPFFPDSTRRNPAPAPMAVVQAPKPAPRPVLHLKGVVGKSAIINNAILTAGDPAESVRVEGGTLQVQCLEVGVDYAIVQIQGEAQPKRLELEEKQY